MALALIGSLWDNRAKLNGQFAEFSELSSRFSALGIKGAYSARSNGECNQNGVAGNDYDAR